MGIKRFWEELQRRNVIRAGFTYLAVGWVIMQAAALIFPLFDIGNGILRLLFISLVILFPIWILFAWAYEYTPEGFRKTEEVGGDASLSEATGKKLNAIIIGGLSLAVILLLADRLFDLTGEYHISSDDRSIAVLPFENRGDLEDAYFAQGMAEDILTQLGKISDLQVLSRFTISEYDRKGKTPAEIGAELRVAYLLGGSVRKAGNQLRISCQLIDTDNEIELWSETYDRMMDDVFLIQGELAESVADNLKAKLSPEEASRIERVPTENLVAYNLYLRGREAYNKYTAESLEEAITFYKKSIAEDKSFALAWAGLADAYAQSAVIYGNRSYDYLDTALVVAEQSRYLDDDASETWKAVGLAHAYAGNYQKARVCYQTALEKNPNYDPAITNLANILYFENQIGEAVKLYQKSKRINPLSPIDYANLGSAYRKVGLYDRAMAEINTAISLDPEDWFYLYQLSNLHLYLENYEELNNTVAKMVEVGDSSAAVLDWAAYLTHMYDPGLAWQYLENIEDLADYDIRNNYLVPVIKAYLIKTLSLPGNWKDILKERITFHEKRVEEGSKDPNEFYTLSRIHCILENKEACLDWIAQNIEVTSEMEYRQYEVDPAFDILKDDPRYTDLLEQMQENNERERNKVLLRE